MKTTELGLLILGVAFNINAYAVGIDSKELKLTCSGQIEMTEVKKVGTHSGFTDRGGNWHPATGFAYVESKVTSLSNGCNKIKSKLGIDLSNKQFEHYLSFKSTDEQEIVKLAELKVGNVHKFNAVQGFGYIDDSGYLPFFPLIHTERVNLISDTVSLVGGSYSVDVKKVYGINLWEEGKLELEKLVFDYIDKGEKEISSESLLGAMLENHPEYQTNFKTFVGKLLTYYGELEKTYDAEKIVGNGEVTTIASHIRELSYEYPELYAFDIPNLLVNHPSLVNYRSWKANKKTCLNISAVQLEDAMAILNDKIINGSIEANIKKHWKKPLTVISGGSWPAGCLGKVSSKLSKSIAKDILKKFY